MENILPWLALKNVSGIGNHFYKCLIETFHTPDRVFKASKDDLAAVFGINHHLINNIKNYKITDDLKKEIERIKKNGCRIISLNDSEYPPLLHHIHDPPPILYVKGKLRDTEKSIAVVGSRSASSYGIAMAKRLCRELSSYGLPIVSGMARGVDTAAHHGALNESGGTMAVLGSGLGIVYPPENMRLFKEIVKNGAVISEFPILEKPHAYNFPARNRIIAGITLGTVVVEAARKSGSLITARLAGEQGREVFAVPGNINSSKSAGTHNLIKQGAKLVSCAQDVIEEFHQLYKVIEEKAFSNETSKTEKVRSQLNRDESRIYKILEPYPMHIDIICKKSEMTVGKLSGILLSLELKGMVKQNPGKYFLINEDQ